MHACRRPHLEKRPSLIILAVLLGVFTTAIANAATTIRVNVGGPAYTDAANNIWSADSGGNGAGTSSQSNARITGTSDPSLFANARFDPPGGAELQYSFAVPAGQYRVNLLFAENDSSAFAIRKRIFDVRLEGTTAFAKIDIFKEVGAHAALIKTTKVTVSDGTLNLELLHVVGNPQLSAIEITSLTASTNAAPTISGTPTKSIAAGQPYRFQPTARDANGDKLTFSIQNKPSWATFNASTGQLSGNAVAGNYSNIIIRVSDGKASATLPSFGIGVTAAAAGATSSVLLTWMPPTRNADGSVLTDLKGYRITYGTSAQALNKQIRLTNAGLTSYVVEDLAPATYYFAITSFNSAGTESAMSPTISKAVR
jgi:hypothetical protein